MMTGAISDTPVGVWRGRKKRKKLKKIKLHGSVKAVSGFDSPAML